MFAAFLVSGVAMLLALVLIPLGLLLMAFWIWMLVDAIRNRALADGEKIGWVLAIVFLHFLGSALYFFIGRPKRRS
jgi:hypothetical protein